MASTVHVTKSEIPESTEILAASIVEIGNAAKKLMASGLTKRGLIVLIQEGIGVSKISKREIEAVLDALPRLHGWYVQKPPAEKK